MEPVRYFLWEVSCGLCCTRWEAASASIYSSFGEHYAQALVMRVSFFWGSAGGSGAYFCHAGEISDRTPEPSDKGLVSWHREYFALKGKKHHARESEQARHGTVRPE